jgi:hypothetical protein
MATVHVLTDGDITELRIRSAITFHYDSHAKHTQTYKLLHADTTMIYATPLPVPLLVLMLVALLLITPVSASNIAYDHYVY